MSSLFGCSCIALLTPQCRNSPWFRRDVPDYLEKYERYDGDFEEIDNSIVEYLSEKLQYSQNVVLSMIQSEEPNDVRVAYQLAVAHRQLEEQGVENAHLAHHPGNVEMALGAAANDIMVSNFIALLLIRYL